MIPKIGYIPPGIEQVANNEILNDDNLNMINLESQQLDIINEMEEK